MATADQLKALLLSHAEGDDQRFYSVAMQVAAHEARPGHHNLAGKLRDLIDEAKKRRVMSSPVPISQPRGELGSLLDVTYPKSHMQDLVLSPTLDNQLHRILREQLRASDLLAHGFIAAKKVLARWSSRKWLDIDGLRLDTLLTKIISTALM